MRVVVDAYGGDNAPLEIVKGAALASNEYGAEITLTGKKQEIEKYESNISTQEKAIKEYEAEIAEQNEIIKQLEKAVEILKNQI